MHRTKPIVSISLGWWTLYFALKLALYASDTLNFSPLYNFSLLCFIAIPLRSRWLNIARHSVAVVLALLLLHHDSYLPPIERLFSQWDLVSQFDTAYLLLWQKILSRSTFCCSASSYLWLTFISIRSYVCRHSWFWV